MKKLLDILAITGCFCFAECKKVDPPELYFRCKVWQNPYEEHIAVAISPSVIRYNLTYCSVALPTGRFRATWPGRSVP